MLYHILFTIPACLFNIRMSTNCKLWIIGRKNIAPYDKQKTQNNLDIIEKPSISKSSVSNLSDSGLLLIGGSRSNILINICYTEDMISVRKTCL